MEFPGNNPHRSSDQLGHISGYGLDTKYDAEIDLINDLNEDWRRKTGKMRIQSLIQMYTSQQYADSQARRKSIITFEDVVSPLSL